jgi:hypothetical protein
VHDNNKFPKKQVSQTISRSQLSAVMDLRGGKSYNHITSDLTEATQYYSHSLAQVLTLYHRQSLSSDSKDIYLYPTISNDSCALSSPSSTALRFGVSGRVASFGQPRITVSQAEEIPLLPLFLLLPPIFPSSSYYITGVLLV